MTDADFCPTFPDDQAALVSRNGVGYFLERTWRAHCPVTATSDPATAQGGAEAVTLLHNDKGPQVREQTPVGAGSDSVRVWDEGAHLCGLDQVVDEVDGVLTAVWLTHHHGNTLRTDAVV